MDREFEKEDDSEDYILESICESLARQDEKKLKEAFLCKKDRKIKRS